MLLIYFSQSCQHITVKVKYLHFVTYDDVFMQYNKAKTTLCSFKIKPA